MAKDTWLISIEIKMKCSIENCDQELDEKRKNSVKGDLVCLSCWYEDYWDRPSSQRPNKK